jgi:DNA segregation ATPase FtsK/SpoIIIE-like protein
MYIVSMTKKTNQLMLTSRVVCQDLRPVIIQFLILLMIFFLQIMFFLFLAWRASWLEVGITGHTLVQIGPVASEELIKM